MKEEKKEKIKLWPTEKATELQHNCRWLYVTLCHSMSAQCFSKESCFFSFFFVHSSLFCAWHILWYTNYLRENEREVRQMSSHISPSFVDWMDHSNKKSMNEYMFCLQFTRNFKNKTKKNQHQQSFVFTLARWVFFSCRVSFRLSLFILTKYKLYCQSFVWHFSVSWFFFLFCIVCTCASFSFMFCFHYSFAYFFFSTLWTKVANEKKRTTTTWKWNEWLSHSSLHILTEF